MTSGKRVDVRQLSVVGVRPEGKRDRLQVHVTRQKVRGVAVQDIRKDARPQPPAGEVHLAIPERGPGVDVEGADPRVHDAFCSRRAS